MSISSPVQALSYITALRFRYSTMVVAVFCHFFLIDVIMEASLNFCNSIVSQDTRTYTRIDG